MVTHLARIVGLTLLLTACALLPFLPGDHDGGAVTLSEMSRVAALVAAVLVAPIGAAWLAYELWRRPTDTPGSIADDRRADKRRTFATAAVVASFVVAAAASLAAVPNLGFYSGFLALALCAYGVWRIATKSRDRSESAQVRGIHPAPLNLACVPIAALLLQWMLVPPAAEFSRIRAIAGSAAMIRDIEKYFDANGHYPQSLDALWNDYKPSVIGVERFCYEPCGSVYNLYFEHPNLQMGTREIVMYNKLDEHAMTSHDSRILRSTPQAPYRRMGWYALLDTSTPHWRRFLFD